MKRRLALTLVWAVLACDDPGGPGGPALALQILSPTTSDAIHDLDPLTLVGEVGASDLGLLPDDSIWWTHDGTPVGTGRRVEFRAVAGRHRIGLHARYGRRSDSTESEIDVAADGLGRLLWSVPLDTNTAATLAFDPAGILHAMDNDLWGRHVAVAIGVDGSLRWRVETGLASQKSPPAIGPDGAQYYGYWIGPAGGPENKAGGVLVLNPDGTRRWAFIAAENAPPGGGNYDAHGGVALDPTGVIYVATEEQDFPFYAIHADGTLRWRAPSGNNNEFYSYTTLLADSLLATFGRRDAMTVVGADDGLLRWSAPVRGSFCLLAPAVGADGTVYVPDPAGRITAYSASGGLLWDRPLPTGVSLGSPVVGRDRIYLAASNGGVMVLSLGGDPAATWGPAPAGFFHDGITLAANGVVYVAIRDTLLSYDAGGNRRFAVSIPHRLPSQCSDAQGGPVIGPDGTVYLRASDFGVMAFRDTVGPAIDAPWPTLQGNFQRTGRRATDQ